MQREDRERASTSGASRPASGHARWSVRQFGAPPPTAAAASGARRSRGETSCFLAGPPPRTPGIRRHVSRRARTHVLVRDELDTLNHEPLAVRVRCLPALERQRSATRDPALRGDLDGVKAGRERELRVATMLWHERRQPRPRPSLATPLPRRSRKVSVIPSSGVTAMSNGCGVAGEASSRRLRHRRWRDGALTFGTCRQMLWTCRPRQLRGAEPRFSETVATSGAHPTRVRAEWDRGAGHQGRGALDLGADQATRTAASGSRRNGAARRGIPGPG